MRVTILMATHNGEKFVEEQIRSIQSKSSKGRRNEPVLSGAIPSFCPRR